MKLEDNVLRVSIVIEYTIDSDFLPINDNKQLPM